MKLVLIAALVFADVITVKGTIDEFDGNYYITSNGVMYEIALFDCTTPSSEKCPICRIAELVDTEVEATGIVKEEAGKRIMTILKIKSDGEILLPCRAEGKAVF